MSKNPFDIICLNETFCDSSVSDEELSLPEYTIVRRDRNRHGGGVAMYIRNNLTFIRRNDLEADDVECLWVELKCKLRQPVLISSIYRPPSSSVDFLDKINYIIDRASCECKEMIVLGDFNFDVSQDDGRSSNLITTCFEAYQMTQLINDPTRVTESTQTIIDLIFSSHPERVSESGVLPVHISDHYLVYGLHHWKVPKKTNRSINFRCFNDIETNAFQDDLLYAPWEQVYSCQDVNEAWSTWHSLFMAIINHHAPIKSKRIRGASLPWLDGDILKLMRQRDCASKLAKRSGSQDDWNAYKKLRNITTEKIRSRKSEYFKSTIEENKGNSSILWKKLKDVLPNKQKMIPKSIVTNDGKIFDDLTDIADAFNEHFSTIGSRMASNAPQYELEENDTYYPAIDLPDGKCSLPEITEDYVKKQILSMSVGKTTGPDGISVKMIKLACPYITRSLTYILNLSIRCGQYPSEWKHALVSPIHKGGDKCNTTNFRPISILPIISKILERWVHSVVYSYLDESNLIPSCQSGFRPLHSTETTLHDITNKCLQAMEHGKMTGTVFIDLSKAFDSVNHEILLEKLEKLNMSASVLNWFKSYLSERSQSVNLEGNISKALPLNTGVPQGSILGPLLFIIYTSDLPYCIPKECNLFMYADDSTLTCSSSNVDEIQNNLNTALAKIYNWCARNKLTINASKTKSMLIGTKQKVHGVGLNVTIAGNSVVKVDHCKCLGVIIDESLSWGPHVEYVKKTVSCKMGMLKRIRDYVPQSSLKSLFVSLVMPSLDYCSTVWGGRYISHVNVLNQCLKRAARMILRCEFSTPSADMFSKLNWMSFSERVEYKKAILVHKCVNKTTALYMTNMFTPLTQTRVTRQSTEMSLKVPFAKKECYASSFAVTGSVIWNNLHVQLRTMTSLNSFKSELRKTFTGNTANTSN